MQAGLLIGCRALPYSAAIYSYGITRVFLKTQSSQHRTILSNMRIHKCEHTEQEPIAPPTPPKTCNRRKASSSIGSPGDTTEANSTEPVKPKTLEGDDDAARAWRVYLLLSSDRKRTYVGMTNDLSRRLRQHNGEIRGGAKSCRAGARPWQVVCVVNGFRTRSQALQFECWWKRVSATAKSEEGVPEELIRLCSYFKSPLILRRRAALETALEKAHQQPTAADVQADWQPDQAGA